MREFPKHVTGRYELREVCWKNGTESGFTLIEDCCKSSICKKEKKKEKENQYLWSAIKWGMLVFTECSKCLNCLSRTHLISCLCGHRLYLPSCLANVFLNSWDDSFATCFFCQRKITWTNLTNGHHVVSLLFCLTLFKVEESLAILPGSSRASLLTQFSVLSLYISDNFFFFLREILASQQNWKERDFLHLPGPYTCVASSTRVVCLL